MVEEQRKSRGYNIMNLFNTATLEQLLHIIDVSGYKLVINDGFIKMLVKEVEK